MGALEQLQVLMQLARFKQSQATSAAAEGRLTTDPRLIDEERRRAMEREDAERALVQPLDSELSDSGRFLARQMQIRDADPEKVDERTVREALATFGGGPSQRTQLKFQLIDAGIMAPAALDSEEKVLKDQEDRERMRGRREEAESPAETATRELTEAQTRSQTADLEQTESLRELTHGLTAAKTQGETLQVGIDNQALQLAPSVNSFADLMNTDIVPVHLRGNVAAHTGMTEEFKAHGERVRAESRRAQESARFGFIQDPIANRTANEYQDIISREQKRLEPGGDMVIWQQVPLKEKERLIEEEGFTDADFQTNFNMTTMLAGQDPVFFMRRPEMAQVFENIVRRIVIYDSKLQDIIEKGSVGAGPAAPDANIDQERRELEARRAFGMEVSPGP